MKRCAKIAELLVEGKKGVELDVAIHEFDKTHVPEIITRFEAPITARAFRRRSLSAPPETEEPLPFLITKAPSPSRVARSASVRPPSSLRVNTSPFFPEDAFYSAPQTPFNLEGCQFPTGEISSQTFSYPSHTEFPLDLFTRPTMAQQPFVAQQPSLSIDTSFMNTWTRSSTPMSSVSSPGCYTPCDLQTPLDFPSSSLAPFPPSSAPFDFSSYTHDPCSNNFFFPSTTEPQVYSDVDAFSFDPNFTGFPAFASDLSNMKMPELPNVAVDFSTFMASYPL
jgi:hypothetical protein